MNQKVLFVDDEQNVLQAYQRSLRKDFQIDTALGGAEGLVALARQGPYAVIITDMRMPRMDGVEFLAKAKELAPETVRVMLTGNADQQTAIEAVNEGSIFRFLNKPCPSETLAKTLVAALEQYRLVRAEKELLSKTLNGSIQVLSDILSLVNPTAFGRAARVRRLVKQIASTMKVENAWQVEIAAMLSQLGCITVPQETLWRVYRNQPLSADEIKMMQAHPQIGHDLLSHVPRLEEVAEIIAYQNKLFNGGGWPGDKRCGDEIPIGARILKLALDFDKLAESCVGNFEALKEIQSRLDYGWYDPAVVQALEVALVNEIHYETIQVKISELTPDMILAEDIISLKGMLLITKGQEVRRSLCVRLQNFYEANAITELIKVLVPVRHSAKSSGELAKAAWPQQPLGQQESRQGTSQRCDI
jgi:response regulator RpfG family c-di-GMP phosphodiesterase